MWELKKKHLLRGSKFSKIIQKSQFLDIKTSNSQSCQLFLSNIKHPQSHHYENFPLDA